MDSEENSINDSTAEFDKDLATKKKKKFIAIAIVAVALLSGGGFFMLKKSQSSHKEDSHETGHGEEAHNEGSKEGHDKGHKEGHKEAEAPKHPKEHEDDHGTDHAESTEHGDAHDKKKGHSDEHSSGDTASADEAETGHGDSHKEDSHKGGHKAAKSKGHKKDKNSGKMALTQEVKDIFKEHAPRGLLEKVGASFESIHDKVVAMHHAEVNNERLKLENINLRNQLERTRFECQGTEALKFTKDLELKLTEEAGTKVARTLASIRYKPPEHLLPVQLYTLAVTYFKGHEDEKAAVLFTYLTGLEDNDSFKSAKNYLMTGVTWYRLEHFELSEQYFKKVLELNKTKETQPFQAQARLWKAILAERQGKHVSAQSLLKELVDFNPRSREAGWVNGGVPAVYLEGRSTSSVKHTSGVGSPEVDHEDAEDDEDEE